MSGVAPPDEVIGTEAETAVTVPRVFAAQVGTPAARVNTCVSVPATSFARVEIVSAYKISPIA